MDDAQVGVVPSCEPDGEIERPHTAVGPIDGNEYFHAELHFSLVLNAFLDSTDFFAVRPEGFP